MLLTKFATVFPKFDIIFNAVHGRITEKESLSRIRVVASHSVGAM